VATKIDFNGTTFTLSKAGYFYSPKRQYLHRVIWESYNGPIPEGMEIHHRDGNKAHNEIGNYELKTASEHARHHWVVDRRVKDFVCEQCGKSYQSSAAQGHNRFCSNNCCGANRRASGLDDISRPCENCGQPFTVNRYVVKPFCSQSCTAVSRQPKQCVCTHCGRSYQTSGLGKNCFCSSKCNSAHRRASGVDDVSRTCAHCGRDFTINRYSPVRHCGKSCSAIAWRKRNPDGETDEPQAIRRISGS
jgi:endogenous inhibitor of DNA gyrase (YacG/DUF329 family)